MHLTTIDEIKDYSNAFYDDSNNTITSNEIFSLLEAYLTGEYRTLYLKVKSGAKVNKSDMDKLSVKLKEILKNHG